MAERKKGTAEQTGEEGSKICGLVMPISASSAYDAQHWQDVRRIVEAGVEKSGLIPRPVWESDDTDIIQGRIVRNLYENPVIVCDISGLNPNVMFELGMRLTFKKPVVIIADDATKLPFDTNVIEHLIYPSSLHFHRMNEFMDTLAEYIIRVLRSTEMKTYQPYLDTFGAFTVSTPEPRKQEIDDYIVNQLERLNSSIARLERDFAGAAVGVPLPSTVSGGGWTDERLDRLRELWAQGMTASQIADELGGVSRNAVIGKAFRLGLQSRPSGILPTSMAVPKA